MSAAAGKHRPCDRRKISGAVSDQCFRVQTGRYEKGTAASQRQYSLLQQVLDCCAGGEEENHFRTVQQIFRRCQAHRRHRRGRGRQMGNDL